MQKGKFGDVEMPMYASTVIISSMDIVILLMEESCTSSCGKYTIVYTVWYIAGGAGFLPSTVLFFTRMYCL